MSPIRVEMEDRPVIASHLPFLKRLPCLSNSTSNIAQLRWVDFLEQDPCLSPHSTSIAPEKISLHTDIVQNSFLKLWLGKAPIIVLAEKASD